MQKLATRIFIIASVVFLLLGTLVVVFTTDNDQSTFDTILIKSFFITVLVILTSFALSVAGKYLEIRNT